MDTLLGNMVDKYLYFGIVIMDTGLPKKVHKGKRRKTIVIKCNQELSVTVFQQNGPKHL